MVREFSYKLLESDLPKTANGVAGQILKQCLHLKGHEFCHAKYIKNGITRTHADGSVEEIYVSDRLVPADILTVRLVDPADSLAGDKVPAVEGPVDILYEDEDLTIINKPAGIVVHPCHGHYTDTAANFLMWYYKSKGLEVVCRSIGRLDRETSGALLFAKNKASAGRLSIYRDEGNGGHKYLALAEGHFEKKHATINKAIAQVPGVKLKRQTAPEGEGQYAITHYSVLGESVIDGIDVSFLEVKIETGRTHQIRVHMESIGHPLIGDTLYGNPKNSLGMTRALLHAYEIKTIQPFSREEIIVRAPLPEDFKSLISKGNLWRSDIL